MTETGVDAVSYRTVQIKVGGHVLTAEQPPPGDLADAIQRIHRSARAHESEKGQEPSGRIRR
ncbi:MAG: hypothetical protein U0904_08080 [Candidatus Nanopelagicales bacterium]|nr:hypothetical protein [Candidatus Nanopelagicales bacterium]